MDHDNNLLRSLQRSFRRQRFEDAFVAMAAFGMAILLPVYYSDNFNAGDENAYRLEALFIFVGIVATIMAWPTKKS